MFSIDLCQLLESKGMTSVIKCLNKLCKRNLIKLFCIVKNNTAIEYNFKVIFSFHYNKLLNKYQKNYLEILSEIFG